MIKKTLYFGNPVHLTKKNNQLLVRFPEEIECAPITRPIEDIGIMLLDNPQISITHALIVALQSNNTVLISCDEKHLPFALMLPMNEHHTYAENLRIQIGASEPLKKQLWQQNIKQKILNQAAILQKSGREVANMQYWAKSVRSGDSDNYEARAAAHYWKHLFDDAFNRGRFEDSPNNLLNYGYAVLRACVARALVGSGLHNSLGIHHRNKYNPYALADDLMEAYRPFVDELVLNIIPEFTREELEDLSPKVKQALLKVPVLDVVMEGKTSPLMLAVSRSTASLMACYKLDKRKLLLPQVMGYE